MLPMAEPQDAFDRMPVGQFVALGRGTRRRHKGRKKKVLARLIREQADDMRGQSGRSERARWWQQYHAYIESPRWKKTKERIMRERGVSCERCGVSGSVVKVQLHHVSYANMGHERDEDLKLLCGPCHQLMHPNKAINFQKAS